MKNLKKKTTMKSKIFGIEYTAEEKERMAQVMLSATQFMKNYGKGIQPRVMGDVILNHTGNAGKVSEDENHKYTAFDAPAKYVKDIDLYKYTSLTYEQVNRFSHLSPSHPKRIKYRTYGKTNYNHILCEYYLPDILKVEEMLKEERKKKKAEELIEAEEDGSEKTQIICKYTSMFHCKKRENEEGKQ